MRRTITLLALIGLAVLLALGTGEAQEPSPLATATPVAQVVVVTATPGATATPTPVPSIWQLTEGEVPWWLGWLGGLLLLIAGALGAVLRPVLARASGAAARGLGKLGSGWGFKKRYLTHLIEEHRCLNVRGIKTRAPVSVDLEQVYVSLRAQAPDVARGRQDPPPMDIGQALTSYDRLVVLGGPGTGKTTLLAYLTLTYTRGQVEERFGFKEKRLPIFVPLRQLKTVLDGDGATSLPAYLVKWYTELGLSPGEGFFERALRKGRCLVLLDGLDEVANEDERRRMSEWVDRQVAVYRDNRYVVTSRPPGYDTAPLGRGFTVLHVRDFTGEEIRQFADNWCRAVEIADQGEDNPTARRRAQEAMRDLVGAIEANDDIRKLAVNPLLLSIIALVHRYRGSLPGRRVELYAECVDVLLGHWDAARGLVGTLSLVQKRAVLQALALEMHEGKRQEIPHRELEAQIGELLPKVGGQPDDVGRFLDEVRERSGLLIEAGLDTYRFSHLAFQEYLAAREVADDETKRDLLVNNAGDEWWQEVALLYVGMTDATAVVEALMEDDQADSRLLLAGRCVAEAARMEEGSRERVGRRLFERLADETRGLAVGEESDDETDTPGEPMDLVYVARKVAARRLPEMGKVLGELGEDIVGFCLRIAREGVGNEVAAVLALQWMGLDKVQHERLLEQLVTHLRGEELWEDAGAVLVGLWELETLAELHERRIPVSHLEYVMDALAARLDGRMVAVPAGEFLMGDKKRKVHVDAFHIDRYPVTNVQYKRFVEATGHAASSRWKDGSYLPEKALHPVVGVTWHDAAAYAEWAGKRLPTEEEWEKAARGTEGREYPWGEWEEGRCNTKEAGIEDTTLVGQYSPSGDSPYGCADMAGNVWEWTASKDEGGRRIVRGGSWLHLGGRARCACRHWRYPALSVGYFGFRCVFPVSGSEC